MSHNAFRTFTVDLSQPADRRELVPQGTALAGLVVTQFPASGAAFLVTGSQADALRILGVGMSLEFDRCTPESEGLFVTVPAGQAGTLELTVFLAGGGAGARVQS